jgi:assimilatory nitrate reductase catalytic subunit
LSAGDRAALLMGRAPGRPVETGPVVCACRNVRADRIAAAIGGGAATVEAVGEATTAGTVCGSCRPEIARFLALANAERPAATERTENGVCKPGCEPARRESS